MSRKVANFAILFVLKTMFSKQQLEIRHTHPPLMSFDTKKMVFENFGFYRYFWTFWVIFMKTSNFCRFFATPKYFLFQNCWYH